ncbi:MAG: regulatory iron-sulfur-containing complex subunit RicT [Bacteroidota bacterium]
MDNIIEDTSQNNNIVLSRGCCTVKGSNPDDLFVNQQRCCKLSAYDWLSDYTDPSTNTLFNYVEVRFKNGRKDFFTFSDDLILKKGEVVAVEASPGHDIGIITLAGEIVRIQMKRKQVDPEKREIKRVFRHARTADIEKWLDILKLENPTMLKSRSLAANLNLNMKINDVEYQGDKTKAIFYYTANDRVDFRELIRSLADSFKIRIEMKQIGVRQEAAKVGGIGPCGRELCCSSYMSNFSSVSTNSARIQQLSLNPQKLAGQCGKLKCCLNYEVDDYIETLKEFPSSSIPLKTKKGKAYFIKSEVFKKTMWYAYAGESNNMMEIPIDKVKEIINLNKKGKFPPELEEFSQQNTQVDTSKDEYSDDITGYI